ncbi:MAG: FtsQ-type POTRA domain-containing protein, partial [Candidatus Eremiobacteraeota bacterium]|nr:FtsQ-type POTRA domain-containing protein [Candidatus Eremiobacteraeota bacterium]
MSSIRARRRTKPSLLLRLRIFWIFIVVALVGAAYGGYLVATWPGFVATTVVVDGNRRVAGDAILARAAIPRDRNVWFIDKRAAERRIETIPWVERAQIHRSLPAAVTIVVAERLPAACIRTAAAQYLVDATAHVLAANCAWSSMLPEMRWPPLGAQAPGAVLDAARLTRLLRDAQTLEAQQLAPAAMGLDRFDGLEVWLKGGPLVRFGDDGDLAEKARLVGPILRTYAVESKAIAEID